MLSFYKLKGGGYLSEPGQSENNPREKFSAGNKKALDYN